MADQHGPDDATFARYFSGESDASERVYVERWIAADPLHTRLGEHLRAVWGRVIGADQAFDLPGIWRHLAREVSCDVGQAVPVRPTSVGPRGWPPGVGAGATWRWAAISASVVVVLGVGLAIGIRRRGAVAGGTGRKYATAAGQRLSVTLVDGTQLTLAPASRVRLAADYGQSARGVELDGEAYFVVVHDERRPFTVRTSWAVTRDVGTAFVVRSYAEDRGTRVAVQEGIVSLDAGRGIGPSTRLTAGALAGIDASGQVTVQRNANLAPYIGWTQGGLAFDNTPLREVARDLARAFDLHVTVVDSTLAAKVVTASYGDQPVDAILEDITAIVGARYERSGRAVVIRPRTRGAGRMGTDVIQPLSTAMTGTFPR